MSKLPEEFSCPQDELKICTGSMFLFLLTNFAPLISLSRAHIKRFHRCILQI